MTALTFNIFNNYSSENFVQVTNLCTCGNEILYSAKILRAVNFADFTVFFKMQKLLPQKLMDG